MSRVLDHVVCICYHRCQLMMLTATQGISSPKAWNCCDWIFVRPTSWLAGKTGPFQMLFLWIMTFSIVTMRHRVIYVAIYPHNGDRTLKVKRGWWRFPSSGSRWRRPRRTGIDRHIDRWFHNISWWCTSWAIANLWKRFVTSLFFKNHVGPGRKFELRTRTARMLCTC